MFILASNSPRRKEILSSIMEDFLIVPSNVDERITHLKSSNLSSDLAKQKAYDVFARYPNDVVLGCDTIVVFKGEIFNKPKDKEDARRMLRALSGNHHVVLTSYTIISKDYEIAKTVRSDVIFNELSEDLIEKYISTGSPMDKAGAYGIQDDNFHLIKKITGSINNVKGLPSETLMIDLKKLNII